MGFPNQKKALSQHGGRLFSRQVLILVQTLFNLMPLEYLDGCTCKTILYDRSPMDEIGFSLFCAVSSENGFFGFEKVVVRKFFNLK
jgi:hypothetical protein